MLFGFPFPILSLAFENLPGTAVTWGDERFGGSASVIQDQGGQGIASRKLFMAPVNQLSMTIWLVVWLPSILFSHFYWECHHPN